jgi:hypothetical protein
MFNKSVPRGSNFETVWHTIAVSHVDGEESSQYLIDRSLMRPRELIECVNICRGFAANRNHNRIEAGDFADGLKIYSKNLAEEISFEIRDVFPDVPDAVYVFITASKILKRDDIELYFMDAGIPETKWTELIDILLWYGVLGFADPNGDTFYIYSDNVSYDMRLLTGRARKIFGDKPVYAVNPAFWPCLDIR